MNGLISGDPFFLFARISCYNIGINICIPHFANSQRLFIEGQSHDCNKKPNNFAAEHLVRMLELISSAHWRIQLKKDRVAAGYKIF